MKVCLLYFNKVWLRTKYFEISNMDIAILAISKKYSIVGVEEVGFFIDTHYFLTRDSDIELNKLIECEKELETVIDLYKNTRVKKPFLILQQEMFDADKSND